MSETIGGQIEDDLLQPSAADDATHDTAEAAEQLSIALEEHLAPVVGDTSRGREASAVVRSLVKAARSIILYAADNQAVYDFLIDFRSRVQRFLAKHGELSLEIRPWDITSSGEVIYNERDRERSLSLRLYRDGVRRLTILADASWEELTELVTILSVRFKGIRQQEEDAVTLLWKAGFTGIRVDAVAGFVAEEDDELPVAGTGEALSHNVAEAVAHQAPYEFNYPWPQFVERAAVRHRPLSPDALERLLAEDGEESLPGECLTLIRELMRGQADGIDTLAVEDVAPLLREIRDYLLLVGRLDRAVELACLVASLAPPEEAARRELLRACVDEHALARIASGASGAAGVQPPHPACLRDFANLLLPEHLDGLLDQLGDQVEPPPELRVLVETSARRNPERVRARLFSCSGGVAAALVGLYAAIAPAEAVDAATDLLATGDEEMQLACLELLRGAPYSARIGKALTATLGAAGEEARLGALQLLVHHRERRAFPAIKERIQQLTTSSASAREAGALGAALAFLDPTETMRLMRELIRPGGVLQRVIPRHPLHLQAAVSALARLAEPESDELLAWLERHGPDEIRERCAVVLARRAEQL